MNTKERNAKKTFDAVKFMRNKDIEFQGTL